MQGGGHDAHRRFKTMLPWAETAQAPQCDHQTDHPVTAHAEIADVVKENRPGHARWVNRLQQQRSDQYFRTARFVDHRRTEMIVLLAEPFQTLRHATATKVGSAADDDPRR